MSMLVNLTPFPATTFSMLDSDARQFDVVVASATFEARPGQPVRIAEEQSPIREVDEFRGEPGRSSVRHEGQIAPEKARVDVLVEGHAFAPAGRKAGSLMVELAVADVRKALRVSGDRFWSGGSPSSPRPFERLPIVYERAFGGSTSQHMDLRNPVGLGFHRARSADTGNESELPNVEYPSQLMRSRDDVPGPAGFCVVARHVQPRAGYAGTFDAAWQAEQWPLLPRDFDARHHQCAPPDQQSDRIAAGDTVEVTNMTPEGWWLFQLPTLDLPLRLWPPDLGESRLRMDAIVLEPDHHRVTLIARTRIALRRNRPPLEEMILGPVSPAWWRARLQGKRYLNWAAGRGVHIRAGIEQP